MLRMTGLFALSLAGGLAFGSFFAATAAQAQDGATDNWPGDAVLALSPVAAPVGVMEESAVAWIEAKLAVRTLPDAVELWIDAEIDLDDLADAAERALDHRWLNDDCGDELSTSDATILPSGDGRSIRVSFDVAYKRNQCAVGRSGLVKATGRATADLWVEAQDGRPVLLGKLVEDGFAPEVELLGLLQVGGLDEAETRKLLLSLLQDQFDRELRKANEKIMRAVDDAPVKLHLEKATIVAESGAALMLDAQARASADAEAVDLLIGAAVTRGFD